MAAGADPVAALEEELRRHAPQTRPLQHALAQFHLGGALLERGDLEAAEAAFTAAAVLFERRGARPEQAKALNGLGAVLRAAGRPELAARALAHAAAGLAAAGLPLEEGAARFNLGLVLREAGRLDEAARALAEAGRLLEPAPAAAQAAAAARELGLLELQRGRPERAEPELERAVALAERARDEPSRAQAANLLGLARLAREDPAGAAGPFATAAAASPRALRPGAFAMAKANLALAEERAGRPERARLAARQALAVLEADPPVARQAAEVLKRLGAGVADLRVALEQEPGAQERTRLLREELVRSADAHDAQLAGDAAQWLEAHRAETVEPVAVAEQWLGALLELPPPALERLAAAAVAAAAAAEPGAQEEFRAAVSRAMARFGVPQMLRLQEVFAAAAVAAGDPGRWR